MSRRTRAVRRELLPDPRHNSTEVSKFINNLMVDGKKSLAEQIFYGALDLCEERSGQPGLNTFTQALTNAKPALEVKSRRVGGATYQVPIEVRPERRAALASRWLISFARSRREKDDGGAARIRVPGCKPRRGSNHQEKGRHAPDGGGEQGVRPLSLVVKSA